MGVSGGLIGGGLISVIGLPGLLVLGLLGLIGRGLMGLIGRGLMGVIGGGHISGDLIGGGDISVISLLDLSSFLFEQRLYIIFEPPNYICLPWQRPACQLSVCCRQFHFQHFRSKIGGLLQQIFFHEFLPVVSQVQSLLLHIAPLSQMK